MPRRRFTIAHEMAADDDLDSILAALDLPPQARARWLAELHRFCTAHGGERRYRDLLALIGDCRARSE
jgi:hypothetical protein